MYKCCLDKIKLNKNICPLCREPSSHNRLVKTIDAVEDLINIKNNSINYCGKCDKLFPKKHNLNKHLQCHNLSLINCQ